MVSSTTLVSLDIRCSFTLDDQVDLIRVKLFGLHLPVLDTFSFELVEISWRWGLSARQGLSLFLNQHPTITSLGLFWTRTLKRERHGIFDKHLLDSTALGCLRSLQTDFHHLVALMSSGLQSMGRIKELVVNDDSGLSEDEIPSLYALPNVASLNCTFYQAASFYCVVYLGKMCSQIKTYTLEIVEPQYPIDIVSKLYLTRVLLLTWIRRVL